MDILSKNLLNTQSKIFNLRDKVQDFRNCIFKDLKAITYCRHKFDNIIRTIYRNPENRLDDN